MRGLASITPQNTAFVFLSFEGPDRCSMAGGVGTRITCLIQALARGGCETHLCFAGDPEAPGEEHREGGPLVLHPWCQWISRYHALCVYQGEEARRYDFPDLIALRFFLPDSFLDVPHHAPDAGLANSSQEPLGLVGMEAMAGGGIAFTGATSEEYAWHPDNACVLQSSDRNEIVRHVSWLRDRPEMRASLQAEARGTAERYTWPRVVSRPPGALECAFGYGSAKGS